MKKNLLFFCSIFLSSAGGGGGGGGEVGRRRNLLGEEARPISHSAMSRGDFEFSGS